MKLILKSTAAALALTAAFAAQATASQSEIDTINAEYEAKFDTLQAEMTEWESEAPDFSNLEASVGATFDVTWEITDFSFDIPEIVFKTREFSLDLPQFKWDRTGFSMDIPKVYMAVTKVGEYPCFRGWKWYSCDIKTKVPQVRMERKDFSLDLPQVWWGRTSFSMDIPEFYSKRVEIKMHLPQFKLESVEGEITAYQEEGESFAIRAQQLGQSQEAAIKGAVADELGTQKAAVVAQFDEALAALDKAIADLRSAGADPANVNTDEGTMNLVEMREQVLSKRSIALAEIDAQIAQLNA
jgi:hypothetical protein